MSTGNSRRIVDAQPGVHPDLERVVLRHLHSAWRGPVARHTKQAFQMLEARLGDLGLEPGASAARPLLLDNGCGTGASTIKLAQQQPQAVVIGVDKSAARLAQTTALPNNALLVRAEAADFCRLAVQAGWQMASHYLLYPNPWPKPGHLQRRWHGHPVWPDMLALGNHLVLRTNWHVYAQEMASALDLSGWSAELSAIDGDGLSPFERKYQASGHSLWQVVGRKPAA